MIVSVATIDRRIQVIADAVEATVEAHGGKVLTSRLHDIGLPVGTPCWFRVVEELERRHGAWCRIRAGVAMITRWQPPTSNAGKNYVFSRFSR